MIQHEDDCLTAVDELTYFKAAQHGWGFQKFISISQLRSMGLLHGDSLRVRVELTIYGPPKSSISFQQQPTGSNPPLNLGFLLGDGDLSDIKIECDSQTFLAHKAILAGRSSVFKAMLMSGMTEANSGVIQVTDITPTALETIVRYLYTGTVGEGRDYDFDLLYEIVYGAEKYGLMELKNYCFQKLAACITDDNVGSLAVAAHLYGAEESIKATVKKFIEP